MTTQTIDPLVPITTNDALDAVCSRMAGHDHITIDTEFVRDRLRQAGKDPESLPPDTLMNPASIAEAYWALHHQHRDGWTHELDIRPYAEPW